MRYRPDLHDRGDVVRLSGKGWRFSMGAVGGLGWTTVYSADFDQNGSEDYLIASNDPFIKASQIVILLMDRARRPTVWSFFTPIPQSEEFPNPTFPFHPVWVVRQQERAVFLAIDPDGSANYVYAAENGRLVARRDVDLKDFVRWTGPLRWSQEGVLRAQMHGWDSQADGLIDGIWLAESGTPGEPELAIAGKRRDGLPTAYVIDSATERDIRVGMDWDQLLTVLRHNWPVKALGPGGWIRVDRGAVVSGAEVQAVWETATSGHGATRKEGNCRYGTAGDQTFRVCGSKWQRWSVGTVEELLADGVTFRSSHTAMNHTVDGEVKLQRPAGYSRVMGVVWMGDEVLAQWGPRLFVLHDGDGRILLPRVDGVGDGLLVSASGGLTLLQDDGSTVQLQGRIHISRK